MVKKKAKKRGVKPGTKRGPYKKIADGLNEAIEFARLANGDWKQLNTPASMGNLPSLISDLTSTIDTLEAQLTAQIDRIKSILK